MDEIEASVRVFDVDPTGEVISAYAGVAKEFRRRLLLKRKKSDIVETVDGLSSLFRYPPSVREPVRGQVERVLEAKLKLPRTRYGRVELGVCGLMGIASALTSGRRGGERGSWMTKDVLAAALWSSLSFLGPASRRKLEALRCRVVDMARAGFCLAGRSSRARYAVPSIDVSRFDEWKDGDDAIDQLRELQINAALDREEIRVLKWARSGESKLVRCGLQDIETRWRAIIMGAELGMLIDGPPELWHLELCVAGIEDCKTVTIGELLNDLGDEQRANLVASVATPQVERAPSVFPIVSSMLGLHGCHTDAELARSASEWAARALIEFSLLRSIELESEAA